MPEAGECQKRVNARRGYGQFASEGRWKQSTSRPGSRSGRRLDRPEVGPCGETECRRHIMTFVFSRRAKLP